MMRSSFIFCSLLSCFLSVQPVWAEIVPSSIDSRFGWMRGDSNTFFSGWDVFSDEDGVVGGTFFDTTPELTGSNGPGGQLASIRETAGGTIPVGSGNIYSPTVVSQFVVNAPSYDLGPGFKTRIVSQYRTLGSELNYAGIALNGAAPDFAQEVSRVDLGAGGPGGGGFLVEYLAGWDVSATAANYTITFGAAESSVSLDRFFVDGSVTAVPEPTTLVMLAGIGLIGLSVNSRRQRRNGCLKAVSQ